MRNALLWAGAALLAIVVALGAMLILPACGLVLPLGLGQISECPATARTASADTALGTALQAEIVALERSISALQCVPELPPPVVPDPIEEAPELDEEMLDRADLNDLQGCWVLDSPYAAQNKVTGEITHFSEWTVCFEMDGTGRETMTGSDGSTCEGPVTGGFVPGQALVIEEAANLPCSNGFAILKRTVTCRLDAGGRALCTSYQSEGGSSAEVIMRRLQEAD